MNSRFFRLIVNIVICLLGGSGCLFTSLDLDRVCSEVMTAKSPCLVGTSDDAGRLVVTPSQSFALRYTSRHSLVPYGSL